MKARSKIVLAFAFLLGVLTGCEGEPSAASDTPQGEVGLNAEALTIVLGASEIHTRNASPPGGRLPVTCACQPPTSQKSRMVELTPGARSLTLADT